MRALSSWRIPDKECAITQPRDYAIETRGLSKSFGSVQALRGVNLRVPRHFIFGCLGPNGAGKTTFIKLLLGLARPSGGSATIFGRDIATDSLAIRERIGYLPQQPRFVEHMTARENLRFAARFFFSGPADGIRRRCDKMLELVGLTDKADRPIKGFSGGEKQRLGIALAQINDPDLLILDEPASALDPLGRQVVLDIMTRLRARHHLLPSTPRTSSMRAWHAIGPAGRHVEFGLEEGAHGVDDIVTVAGWLSRLYGGAGWVETRCDASLPIL